MGKSEVTYNLVLFLFRKKEKKNIEVKCNYYLAYSSFDVQFGTPLSFDTKGAK